MNDCIATLNGSRQSSTPEALQRCCTTSSSQVGASIDSRQSSDSGIYLKKEEERDNVEGSFNDDREDYACDREDSIDSFYYSTSNEDGERFNLYTSQSANAIISFESMDCEATKVPGRLTIRQTLSELSRDAYISLKDSDSAYAMTDLARGELERSIHEKLNDLTAYISQSVNGSFSSTSSIAFQGNEVPGKPLIPVSLSELSSDAYTDYIYQSLNASFTSLPMPMAYRTDDGVTSKEVELSVDEYTDYISQSLNASFTSLMACPANKGPESMKIYRTDEGVTSKAVETPNTHAPQDTKTNSLENSLTIFDPTLIKIQCIVEGGFEMLLLTSVSKVRR